MTTELRTTYTSVMNELADIRKNILRQAHHLSFEDGGFDESAYDEDKGIASIIGEYDGEIRLFQMDGKNLYSRYLYGCCGYDYAEYVEVRSWRHPDEQAYFASVNEDRARMRREWKASGDYYHGH